MRQSLSNCRAHLLLTSLDRWKSKGYFDSTRKQILRDFKEQDTLQQAFWKKAEVIAANHLRTLSEEDRTKQLAGKLPKAQREKNFAKMVTELPEMQRLIDDLWDEFTQKSNAITQEPVQGPVHAERAGTDGPSLRPEHEGVQEGQGDATLSDAGAGAEDLVKGATDTAGKSSVDTRAQVSDDSPKRSRSLRAPSP